MVLWFCGCSEETEIIINYCHRMEWDCVLVFMVLWFLRLN